MGVARSQGWAPCLSHGHRWLDTDSFLQSITAEQCASGAKGAFVAAESHAPPGDTCPNVANHSQDNGCKAAGGYGGEPLCCGDGCGVPSCSNALWPAQTRALFGPATGAGTCGAMESNDQSGVLHGILCCKVGSSHPGGTPPRSEQSDSSATIEMLKGGAIIRANGTDPTLGDYREISRVWAAGLVYKSLFQLLSVLFSANDYIPTTPAHYTRMVMSCCPFICKRTCSDQGLVRRSQPESENTIRAAGSSSLPKLPRVGRTAQLLRSRSRLQAPNP